MQNIEKKIIVEHLLLSKRKELNEEIKNFDFLIESIHNSKDLGEFFLIFRNKSQDGINFIRVPIFSNNDAVFFEKICSILKKSPIIQIVYFFSEIDNNFQLVELDERRFFIFLDYTSEDVNFGEVLNYNSKSASLSINCALEKYGPK
ncbi:MAG: hypothetical protein ACK5BE_04055 [Alphaproteobacteria bacterium]|jgi:hypothetical protein